MRAASTPHCGSGRRAASSDRYPDMAQAGADTGVDTDIGVVIDKLPPFTNDNARAMRPARRVTARRVTA